MNSFVKIFFFAQTLFLDSKVWARGSELTTNLLNQAEAPLELNYRNKPSHQISRSKDLLTLSVRKSSSFLLFPLDGKSAVKSLTLKGAVSALSLKENVDDFYLRVGPALAGQKKLNFLQRAVAPDWIKTLADLGRSRQLGFAKLDLYLVAGPATPSWQTRKHPSSQLISETVAKVLTAPGEFTFEIEFESGRPPALAIWLGADGDDSQAEFDLEIKELQVSLYETAK